MPNTAELKKLIETTQAEITSLRPDVKIATQCMAVGDGTVSTRVVVSWDGFAQATTYLDNEDPHIVARRLSGLLASCLRAAKGGAK